MAQGTLIAHSGGWTATREEIRALPAPKALGPIHKPIPHGEFIDAVIDGVEMKGYEVAREQYALARKGLQVFGVLDIALRGAGGAHGAGERGLSLGFRSANDKSIALQLAAGQRVFVCDNLAFNGDMIVLTRKHTSRLHLGRAVDGGITRYFEAQEMFNMQIDRMKEMDLSDDRASRIIVSAFDRKVCHTRLLPEVTRNFFRPEEGWTDCQGRTVWSLHNAFTRAFKEMPKASSQFRAAARLGKLFGITNKPEGVEAIQLN